MKKIVLVIVAVIIAFFIVKAIKNDGGSSQKSWTDNEISASYPENMISESVGSMPSTAEVYIDASGSMKPYFNADGVNMINTVSEFVNQNVEGTSIYFLGNDRPYSGLVKDILGDIKNQPNSQTSTFHDFFAEKASKLDTVNTMVYLVTDGIMSVDKGTAKALVALRGKIESALKGHDNLAMAVFRYKGGYKGDYWDCDGGVHSVKEEISRPYYIIAMGSKESMRWLRSVSPEKLNNPEKRLFLGVHDLAGHKKPVLALGDSAKIKDVNKDVKLILELPQCLKDIDANLVKLYNNEQKLPIKVEKLEGNRLAASIPVTTPLRAGTNKLITITMSEPNKLPIEWTEGWNTTDDSDGPDETTTFGLKELVSGMFNALETDDVLFSADFKYSR